MMPRLLALLAALAATVTVTAPVEAQTRPVCVRTCDGYFFPLEAMPRGKTTPAQMCRSLCPGAETALYEAPVDGDIDDAVSEKGKPYSALPNAGRYRTSYNPTCSCKKPGESWAQALKGAERLLKGERGDILVTEAKAQELSRAASIRTGKPKQTAKAKDNPVADPVTTGSVALKARDPGTTGSVTPKTGFAQLDGAEASPGEQGGRRPIRVIPY